MLSSACTPTETPRGLIAFVTRGGAHPTCMPPKTFEDFVP